MYATIHGKLQQPEMPVVVPPPIHPPIALDFDATISNSDDEDNDGSRPDDGDTLGDAVFDGVRGDEFDVGKHINISSAFLLDILSEQPVVQTADLAGHGPLPTSRTTISSTPMDDEWEKW